MNKRDHTTATWSITRQQWVVEWHGSEVDYFAVEPAAGLKVAELNRICRERRCTKLDTTPTTLLQDTREG